MPIKPIQLVDPITWRITENRHHGLSISNVLEILSYLSPKELVQCCPVNHTWNNFASHDILWKKLPHDLTIPPGINIKKYIGSLNPIFSHNQILQRVDELCSNVQLGQNILFTCSFPLNPGCTIKTNFVLGEPDTLNAGPNVREACTFVKKLPENGTYIRVQRAPTTIQSGIDASVFISTILELEMPDTQTDQDFLVQLQTFEASRIDRLQAQRVDSCCVIQ